MHLISDAWDLYSSNRKIRKNLRSTVIHMNMSLNEPPQECFHFICNIFKHLLKFSKVQEIFNSIIKIKSFTKSSVSDSCNKTFYKKAQMKLLE